MFTRPTQGLPNVVLRRNWLQLAMPEADMSTYRFNQHGIAHHSRPVFGAAPLAAGQHGRQSMAGVNVCCLEGVESGAFGIRRMDGHHS